jgi:hypothetical protein
MVALLLQVLLLLLLLLLLQVLLQVLVLAVRLLSVLVVGMVLPVGAWVWLLRKECAALVLLLLVVLLLPPLLLLLLLQQLLNDRRRPCLHLVLPWLVVASQLSGLSLIRQTMQRQPQQRHTAPRRCDGSSCQWCCCATTITTTPRHCDRTRTVALCSISSVSICPMVRLGGIVLTTSCGWMSSTPRGNVLLWSLRRRWSPPPVPPPPPPPPPPLPPPPPPPPPPLPPPAAPLVPMPPFAVERCLRGLSGRSLARAPTPAAPAARAA